MGKTIVIRGLEVVNPVAEVSFKNADSILKNYYALNTSVSNTEKTALNVFVGGLLDNNLWQKMLYFYPMLGNNLADMKIDAVSPTTEDLFANSADTGLSVANGMLVATSRSVGATIGERLRTIDTNDFGIVSSIEHGGINPTTPIAIMGAGGNYQQGMTSMDNLYTFRVPSLLCGYNGSTLARIPIAEGDVNMQTYRDRMLYGDFYNNMAYLYKENDLFASGTLYPLTSMTGIKSFVTGQAAGDKYKFLALTKHLTSEEWGIFYSLLNTFLVSVGKKGQ